MPRGHCAPDLHRRASALSSRRARTTFFSALLPRFCARAHGIDDETADRTRGRTSGSAGDPGRRRFCSGSDRPCAGASPSQGEPAPTAAETAFRQAMKLAVQRAKSASLTPASPASARSTIAAMWPGFAFGLWSIMVQGFPSVLVCLRKRFVPPGGETESVANLADCAFSWLPRRPEVRRGPRPALMSWHLSAFALVFQSIR